MDSRYDRLFDLHGKVIFIAGGTGAIGSEMARAVSAYGAKVAVAGRSREAATRAAAELSASGGEAVGVAFDLLESDSIGAAVAAVEARLGPLDALINAAGAH